jgi:hypothetical protein
MAASWRSVDLEKLLHGYSDIPPGFNETEGSVSDPIEFGVRCE